MKSVPFRIVPLLLAAMGAAHAQTFSLDTAGTSYEYDAVGRVLHIRCDGKEVAVAAPVPLLRGDDGKATACPAGSVTVRDLPEDNAKGVFTYDVARDDGRFTFRVELRAEGGSLFVRVVSDASEWEGISSAKLVGDGPWRRLDVSQYGLAHGQPSNQKATYAVEDDLWLWAFWQLDAGNCSNWSHERTENAGDGAVGLGPRALYAADTEGRRMPLDETLELRVAPALWDAVPPSTNKPSLHRDELARSVFVDLWGAAPVEKTHHFLSTLKEIAGGRVRFYTVLQNWQTGGFDSLLPDSIRMPDYPPNPGVGSVEQLAELSHLGTSMGWFGFRTNYQFLREHSPSFRSGEAHYALTADGERKWHTKPTDLVSLAQRQEREIRTLFSPNATFTDQLASGGPASSYLDFDAEVKEGVTMRATAQRQREFADYLHQVHGGPVGSETLNAEYLMGRWVDTADFGIMGGRNRYVTPEYKLRRLQPLTTVHGMGLPYRVCELPPFKEFHSGRTRWRETEALDDYRCLEILFGNGGYVYMPGTPWSYVLTECLLVGRLQTHYANQPVRDVRYWADGDWVTLEDLVEDGFVMHTRPFGDQSQEFARVRIEFENGLCVVVNRSDEDLVAVAEGSEFVLPKSGWIAWGDDVLAYSAYAPGTSHRVDFLEDRQAGIRYLDPRGYEMRGVTTPTLWERRGDSYAVVMQANADMSNVTVDGREVALDQPEPAPLTSLDADFSRGLGGWRPVAGISRSDATPEGWRLWTASPDPQVYSPRMRVAADNVPRVVLRLRIEEGEIPEGTIGQLYFSTESDPRVSEQQVFRFPVDGSDDWQTIELDVASHARWAGQVITGLRLDPVHGPSSVVVTIGAIHSVTGSAES